MSLTIEQQVKCDSLVDQGRKALALSDWEQASEKYADALEIMRGVYGDVSTELAPLLLPYGKALLEVAIKSQGVLGKSEEDQENPEPSSSNPNLQFTHDSADQDDQEDADDADEGQGEQEVEDDDDFTVAWEVLDLSRSLYEKMASEGKEVRRELGECFGLLGDVSLENENFPQAVEDYKSALLSYSTTLPPHAREIAASHYKLAIVLENIPDRRAEAMEHVSKAMDCVRGRMEEAQAGGAAKGKGKGKAKAVELDEETKEKIKDLKEQLNDLEAKLEDLKSSPQAKDVVSESVAHLLGNAPTDINLPSSSDVQSAAQNVGSAVQSAANTTANKVNDLTGMVKRKSKKPVQAVEQEAGKQVEKGKQVVRDGAQGAVETVQEQASKAGEVVQDQASKAGEVIQDQASRAGEVIQDQAGKAAEIVQDQANKAGEVLMVQVSNAGAALTSAAGQAQEAAAEQLEKAQEVVGEQLERAQEAAGETLEAARESVVARAEDIQADLKSKAEHAAGVIHDKAEELLSSVSGTVDALVQNGSERAMGALGAMKSAARAVYQEILSEGEQMTRENVEAITGVADDLKHTRELAETKAEDLIHSTQNGAKRAFEKAVEVGNEIVADVMEEGKEATRDVVDAVAGTAEDVLGGIEKVGREGKRKVEEIVPEPEVEESGKRQRTD